MPVVDNSITLEVKVGTFFTLSTIMEGPTKAAGAPAIPKSVPSMPLPYTHDFESPTPGQEAPWWSDQIGAWEVHYETGKAGNKVMKQMVPELPIGWSDHGSNGPMTLVGMREWQDLTVAASFQLPAGSPKNASGCVGSRVDQMWNDGIVLCVSADGSYCLSVGGPKLGSTPQGAIYKTGKAAALVPSAFSRISLTTVGTTASGSVDGVSLFKDVAIRSLDSGFAAMGSGDWYPIMFDNVSITQAGKGWAPKSPCPLAKAGAPLYARACASNGLTVDDEGFDLLADWGLRHIASGLCVSAASATKGAELSLATCDPTDLKQAFKNDYTRIRNTVGPFTLKAGDGKLKLAGNVDGTVTVSSFWPDTKAGAAAEAAAGAWSTWSYFPNSKQMRNQYVANLKLGYPMCLATCSRN